MLRITLELETFHDLVCYRHQVIEEMTQLLCTGTKGGNDTAKRQRRRADEINTGESIVADWQCIHLSDIVPVEIVVSWISFSLADT